MANAVASPKPIDTTSKRKHDSTASEVAIPAAVDQPANRKSKKPTKVASAQQENALPDITTPATPSSRSRYQRKAKTPTGGYVISYVEPPSPNSEDTPVEEESSSNSSSVEARRNSVVATADMMSGVQNDATQSPQATTNQPKSHKRAKSHKHKKSKKKKREMEAINNAERELALASSEVMATTARLNGVVIATSCIENDNGEKASAESYDDDEHTSSTKPPLTTTIKFKMKVQNESSTKKAKSSNSKKHKRRR